MDTKIKPMTDNPVIIKGLKMANEKPKKKTDNPKIWAIDFDGTLCSSRYPEIGKPNMQLINALITARTCGVQLILWTNREGRYLDEAVKWCRGYGLEFDAVNDNLPQMIDYFQNNSRKVFANLYIDDRAFPWWGDGVKGDLCKLLQAL